MLFNDDDNENDNRYPLRAAPLHYALLVPLKEGQWILAEKLTKKNCRPLRGRSEAFRGLPKWQAVPSEESTVPCTTEDPIGSEKE